jgi:hypothetical protein
MSEEIRTTTTLDDFADAVRNELAAGSEILGGWIQHVQQRGQGERLFELECWIRGLRAFFDPARLPLLPAERHSIVDRSFGRECRTATGVFLVCEGLAAEVARVGQPEKVEFGAFVEGALRRERTIDHNLDRVLEQPSPIDSLAHLVESLSDLRVLADGEGPCGLDRYLGLGRTFRKILSDCRYIDILLSQRFRPQTDRVDSPPLANAIRAVREPVLRRHLTLLLLHVFRLLRYVGVLQNHFKQDRPLSPTLVLFALLDEECAQLTMSLGSTSLRNRLSTQRLKNAVDLALHSLKTTRSRVMEQELPGILALDIPGEFARMENASGLLGYSLQTAVVSIAQALDRNIQARAIFPAMEERQATAQRIKQELWNLLQSVRGAIDPKGGSDVNVLLDKLTAFRSTSMRDLMYRDWAEFERFSDALVTAADPVEMRGRLRELASYLDRLITAVSQRGVQKEPSLEGVDPEPESGDPGAGSVW